MNPLVSVVLPVYNCPQYVGEAIESILAQTLNDFELIILDDGSTDRTPGILRQYADPRIRQIAHSNIGLARTLNRGIEMARGEFIARQDQDDVSLPERLARQVGYLEAHPDCALVGTWSAIWEDERATERGHRHPCENGELQMRMLFDSYLVHSSVIMRRSALDVSGLYSTDPLRNPPEDFDLWLRIMRHFGVANIPEVLMIYREVTGSISRQKAALIQSRAITIACDNLQALMSNDDPDNILHDLVALLREANDQVSTRPNWIGMDRLLRSIESYVLERWPTEAESVKRGADSLRTTLAHARLRENAIRSPVGRLHQVIRKIF